MEQPVTLFELDLEALLAHVPSQKPLTSVARFPAVEQDVAVHLLEFSRTPRRTSPAPSFLSGLADTSPATTSVLASVSDSREEA